MKITLWVIALVAVTVAPGAAFAETYSGKVSNVDYAEGTVRVLRDDTHDYFTVNVTDRSAFSNLKNGSNVMFDASQNGQGAWETGLFQPSNSSIAPKPLADEHVSNSQAVKSGVLTSNVPAQE